MFSSSQWPLVTVLLLTGFLGLTSGASRSGWILWLHGAGAYALLLMSLWKSRVILDVLRRRPRISTQRVAFVAQLEALRVSVGDEIPKVIFNSRTGTVVIAQGVTVRPATRADLPAFHNLMAATAVLMRAGARPGPRKRA